MQSRVSSIVVLTFLCSWLVLAGGLLAHRLSAKSTSAPVRPNERIANWRGYGETGHATGADSSRVQIVVFSDFQCPACRRFASTLKVVRQTFPNVHIAERNYPDAIRHLEAPQAALSAECAAQVGSYEPMRDALFANPDLVSEGRWGFIADLAGVKDTLQLLECVDDGRVGMRVQDDIAAGEALGIVATPTIIVNDSLLGEPPTLSELEARIERLGGGNAPTSMQERNQQPGPAACRRDASTCDEHSSDQKR